MKLEHELRGIKRSCLHHAKGREEPSDGKSEIRLTCFLVVSVMGHWKEKERKMRILGKSLQAVWLLGLSGLLAAGVFAAAPAKVTTAVQANTQPQVEVEVSLVPSEAPGVEENPEAATEPEYRLYVASFNNSWLREFDGETGDWLGVFDPQNSAGLWGASGVTTDDHGHIYVSSANTHQVLRYIAATGQFLDEFVHAGVGGLWHPKGLAFGADGNLYVCSSGNNKVLKYRGSDGAFLGTFANGGPNGTLDEPYDLAWGPDGNLYVSSHENHSVQKYWGVNGAHLGSFVTPLSGSLTEPTGLAFGPDGNLYVCSEDNSKV